MARRYGIEVRPWLVQPPDNAAAPERKRLVAYGLGPAHWGQDRLWALEQDLVGALG